MCANTQSPHNSMALAPAACQVQAEGDVYSALKLASHFLQISPTYGNWKIAMLGGVCRAGI